MKFSLKLVGAFRLGRFAVKTLEYPEKTRVETVVTDLGLCRDLLGIVLINGRHADEQSILREGDTLLLLPMLEGG